MSKVSPELRLIKTRQAVWVNITDIHFDETNPNKMIQQKMQALEKIMKDDDIGDIVPVVLNQKKKLFYKVIDGEHRIRILIRNGVKKVLAIVLKISEWKAKILRQVLNKLRGEHDRDKDTKELKIIFDQGKQEEFEKMLPGEIAKFDKRLEREFGIILYDKKAEEIPTDAKNITKPGDIFKLGNHLVLCADSTIPENVLKLIKDKKPRMIFTDPPYNFKKDNYLDVVFGNLIEAEIFVMNADHPAVNLLKNYHEFFVGFFILTFTTLIGYGNFGKQPILNHRTITHYRKGKTNFQNLLDGFGTVHSVVLSRQGLVKHEKPIEIPRRFIVHYTRPGEIVLDLFGGSGSTLMACEITGRICYTIEKDPKVVDLIIRRFEDYSKIKAKKLDN